MSKPNIRIRSGRGGKQKTLILHFQDQYMRLDVFINSGIKVTGIRGQGVLLSVGMESSESSQKEQSFITTVVQLYWAISTL